MSPILIKFAKCHKDAVMPSFAHVGDSGFDLYTVEEVTIGSNERLILKTGLRSELPLGYEIQIRPRSGISAKTNLTVLVGTIDSCYRGELGVIVHNTGSSNFLIPKGERIGQAVVQHVPAIKLIEIQESELTETTRGAGGFGSTGIVSNDTNVDTKQDFEYEEECQSYTLENAISEISDALGYCTSLDIKRRNEKMLEWLLELKNIKSLMGKLI